MLRSNLFSSAFHTAKLLNNLVKKSPFQISNILSWMKSWITKRHGTIKENKLRYAAVILMAWILEKTGMLCRSLPENKRGGIAAPRRIFNTKQLLFHCPTANFACHESQKFVWSLQIQKHTRAANLTQEVKNKWFQNNSPAFLAATWPCLGENPGFTFSQDISAPCIRMTTYDLLHWSNQEVPRCSRTILQPL